MSGNICATQDFFNKVRLHETSKLLVEMDWIDRSDILTSVEGDTLRITIPKSEFVIRAYSINGAYHLELDYYGPNIRNNNIDRLIRLTKYTSGNRHTRLSFSRYRHFDVRLTGTDYIFLGRLEERSINEADSIINNTDISIINNADISITNNTDIGIIIVGNEVARDNLDIAVNNRKIILDNGIMRGIDKKELIHLITITGTHKKYNNTYESYVDESILSYYRSNSLHDKGVNIFVDEIIPLVLDTDIIDQANTADCIFRINNELVINQETVTLLCETLGIHVNRDIIKFATKIYKPNRSNFHRITDAYYLHKHDYKSASSELGIITGIEKLNTLILGSKRFKNTKSSMTSAVISEQKLQANTAR